MSPTCLTLLKSIFSNISPPHPTVPVKNPNIRHHRSHSRPQHLSREKPKTKSKSKSKPSSKSKSTSRSSPSSHTTRKGHHKRQRSLRFNPSTPPPPPSPSLYSCSYATTPNFLALPRPQPPASFRCTSACAYDCEHDHDIAVDKIAERMSHLDLDFNGSGLELDMASRGGGGGGNDDAVRSQNGGECEGRYLELNFKERGFLGGWVSVDAFDAFVCGTEEESDGGKGGSCVSVCGSWGSGEKSVRR